MNFSTASALLLDGKALAESVQAGVAAAAARLAAGGRPPRLATLVVEGNPSADLYVQQLGKLGARVGVAVEAIRLPAGTGEAELVTAVQALNGRPDVHGILVQQPLPPGVRRDAVLQAIAPDKDVDGATWTAQGHLFSGRPSFVPATAKACMRILTGYGIPVEGQHAVVVGASTVVGKPLSLLLLGAGATVTVCHDRTRDLARHTRQADILVVACGVPGLITAEMVQDGATVIDVGINRVAGRTVGDVDFPGVSARAGAITPVPGGVGPVTAAMIMEHTVDSARRRG